MDNLITLSDAAVIWREWTDIFTSNLDLREKYKRGYFILRRVCDILTMNDTVSYPDLYTMLQAVCRRTGHPLAAIDHFRWKARRVMDQVLTPDNTLFPMDAKALSDALAVFMQQPIPARLRQVLPDTYVPEVKPREREWMLLRRHLRLEAFDKDARFIYAKARDGGDGQTYRVDYLMNAQTQAAAKAMKMPEQFNVLSFIVKDDLIEPQLIVLEPDFLIDITSLAGTITEYGHSAFNYLLKQLKAVEITRPMLLGNFANAFLDDCVNDRQAEFSTSYRKAVLDNVIPFSVMDLLNDDNFKKEASAQFRHIKQTVSDVERERDGKEIDAYLEPSFFCEPLGVQGRFDLLLSDMSMIIELKSGKKDEFCKKAKSEHELQMLLYKEMVYQMFGVARNKLQGRLLYSRYPELIEQRSVAGLISQAMLVRNNIIQLQRGMMEGKVTSMLMTLTPDRLNQNHIRSKLWSNFQQPQLQSLLTPLQQMDRLTAAYFNAFISFVAREQHYAKVGTGKMGHVRSMSALWNEPDDVKIDNGEMISGLRVRELHGDEGVESITLEATQQRSDVVPNLREGDIVVLYAKNLPTDSVGNKQVVRGTVEAIGDNRVKIRLRHEQRNRGLFDPSSLFALEHDYMDMTFGAMYKALYALVSTAPVRRQLLLGQRLPSYDDGKTLIGHYDTEQIDDIVLRAKQADDYFLLVGPPGTGKTSVAMKAMVSEFLASHQTLLLMAYTNRAVDEICAMLETLTPGIDYLRLGSELGCAEAYRDRLLKTQAEKSSVDKLRDLIRHTRVFVSTTSSIGNAAPLFDIVHFDVAIIDEASQILEPQILGILCAMSHDRLVVDKFIMIGDHKQLPAVVLQPDWMTEVSESILNDIGLMNCRNSMFERLHYMAGKNPSFYAMLDHQGRMHPDIADFSSSLFYDGRIRPVPLSHQQEKLSGEGLEGQSRFTRFIATTRMAFFPSQLPKQPGSKCNETEANIIAEIVMAVCRVASVRGEVFHPDREMGIIVPFRKQIAMVREKLRIMRVQGYERITIDTVERFQGSQRNVIIYGTTVTQDYEMAMLSQETMCQGVMVDRKLNVAVTRARKQCFIVGYEPLLRKATSYAKLIDFADRISVML